MSTDVQPRGLELAPPSADTVTIEVRARAAAAVPTVEMDSEAETRQASRDPIHRAETMPLPRSSTVPLGGPLAEAMAEDTVLGGDFDEETILVGRRANPIVPDEFVTDLPSDAELVARAVDAPRTRQALWAFAVLGLLAGALVAFFA